MVIADDLISKLDDFFSMQSHLQIVCDLLAEHLKEMMMRAKLVRMPSVGTTAQHKYFRANYNKLKCTIRISPLLFSADHYTVAAKLAKYPLNSSVQ
jgi:hypothetical protein